MPSLREIRDRIGSVRSTLKITNAMKLVASAKLRKAQQAAAALLPYEAALAEILAQVGPVGNAHVQNGPVSDMEGGFSGTDVLDGGKTDMRTTAKVAIVAVAGNSSLCGAFNANVIRKTQETISGYKNVDVYSVGRKVADAMRRSGFPSPSDYNELVARATYEEASELAQKLMTAYNEGTYSRVLLIYNHFVSTSHQEVLCETYLPFVVCPDTGGSLSETVWHAPDSGAGGSASYRAGEGMDSEETLQASGSDYILEPSAGEIAATLMPQVMRLKIYTIVLDSIAAEYAARTIAMQTASDNARNILDELTLEYNKGRQQQITSEILDLVGGSQQ